MVAWRQMQHNKLLLLLACMQMCVQLSQCCLAVFFDTSICFQQTATMPQEDIDVCGRYSLLEQAKSKSRQQARWLSSKSTDVNTPSVLSALYSCQFDLH